MRESFSADGNDLAGHQGGVICGGIFAYRVLVRGIATDYRGSLCGVLRVLLYEREFRVVQQHTA